MKYTFQINNLECANCANKIEVALNKESYIQEAQLNFVLRKLSIISEEEDIEKLRNQIEKLADSIEHGVKVLLEQDEVKHEVHTCQDKCDSHIHEHTHGHEHGHEHTHEHSETLESREKVWMLTGLGLFAVGLVTKIDWIYIAAYLCVGYDIVYQAARNLLKGRMLDENFLMTIATFAAFAIGEYPEAVAVMAFYKIGEYMQGRAVGYSRKEIAKAMDIRPEFARVIRDGKEMILKPQEVKVGDILEIRAGEKLPLDGEIIEGSTLLDTSMLTGESVPTAVKVGSKVLSGSINKEGVIKVKVSASFKESTVSKILELIENATGKKSKSENFITKFAQWYTPVVVGLAVFVAIVPSLVTGNWHEWIYTSIVFLVISCPCAIVISVPLGFFAGLGASAHKGVLVKGSNYLEALNTIDTVVLDKTGTITKGQFGITQIVSAKENINKEEILKYAALLEQNSNHPIARSIVEAYRKEHEADLKMQAIEEVKEISGEGILALINGEMILAGNEKLMARYNVKVPKVNAIGSLVYVAANHQYLGCIAVADQIKEDSKAAIAKLKAQGIKQVVMLTGDQKEVAEAVGKEVGVDKVYAQLLPQDKVEKLEEVLKTGKAAFVGDGINDAPVLARADVGIAMGGVGSDAAIEASDVVLMTDELSSIGDVLAVAKRTRSIVIQNITFALGIKIIVMLLSLFGATNMWLAIFADVGVSLLAVMNSIRVLGGNMGYMKKMLFGK